MENKILSFKGFNGRMELHEDFVRLDRTTTMGFLMQGLRGKKDIYFKNISSIQIRRPVIIPGYIQFSISGGNEQTDGVTEAIVDENTLAFYGNEKYKKALEIKKLIEKKINQKASSYTNTASEIEKLYSLMQKGVISRKEFEIQKAKALSN